MSYLVIVLGEALIKQVLPLFSPTLRLALLQDFFIAPDLLADMNNPRNASLNQLHRGIGVAGQKCASLGAVSMASPPLE